MPRHAIACLTASLIALSVVTACNEDGVSIEVRRGSTDAARVELYVVDDYCRDAGTSDVPCRQLRPPSAQGYLAGDVYTREDARTFTTDVDADGRAYFTLRADGDRTRVPLVVAVGFDARDARVGAAVIAKEFFTTDGNRRIVTLDPIVEAKVTGTARDDGIRVETWYQDAALGGGCLVYERVSGGMATRFFIVPHDDLDCDGFVAPLECDAFWPDFSTSGSNSPLDFTCVADISLGQGVKACLLGDAGCTDGSPADDCSPAASDEGRKYCVPIELCGAGVFGCKGSSDQHCAFAQLKAAALRPAATRVHCSVPVEAFNAASSRVCNGEPIVYELLGPTLNTMPGATCTGASVAALDGTGFGPFTSVENNLDVTVGPDCAVTLTFQEQFAIADTGYLADHVLRVDFSNNHSVIVPLQIDLVRDDVTCDPQAGQCTLEGANLDPSFVACIDLAP